MRRKSSRSRTKNEINAGSMADIAFLLLIFFLVTTTIVEDSGILVKLPPYSEEPPEEIKLNSRNVYSILVNANNQLLVRGEETKLKNLKKNTIEFITNPNKLENLSEDPTDAIISLKNDRGTNYNTYLEVYNELKAAYNQIWEDQAQKTYRRPYDNLNRAEKKAIRTDYPLIISEAEPTAFGEE